MMALQIDPMILGIGVIVAAGAAASGWLKRHADNQKIDSVIPFAKTIRKAIISNKGYKAKPLLVLMEPHTNSADVFVGEINKDNRAVFDLGEGIGEHLVPESSGNVRPLIIDGLKIYFGDYVSAECMSVEDIRGNNRIMKIREAIPELRGISISTLKSLLMQRKEHWEINCETVLRTLRRGDEDLFNVPQTTEQFVEMLEKAHSLYYGTYVGKESALVDSVDTVVTTYESVSRRKKIIQTSKWKNLSKKPTAETDEAETDEYVYRNVYKGYKGVRWLSPPDANLAQTSSLTCARLQNYGAIKKLEGILEAKKSNLNNWMDEYGKFFFGLAIVVLILIIAGCLGYNMITK